MKNFLYIALPYAALFIFLIGSVYRYNSKGFKVTSLSSQLFENNFLFWGSRSFHWGIIALFFGHLIAFLFPASLIAFNGHPVRLLVIEVSAFAFALLALIGLIILVTRRIFFRKIHSVTSIMDIVIYVLLLVQTVTGIWIAYNHSWGSSWFASSITPYLRSIFLLNPEISVISEMPHMIQIHAIGAFVIIALIPFSRLMHFLVYPLDFLWRLPQLVIWNWNFRQHRQSKKLHKNIKAEVEES